MQPPAIRRSARCQSTLLPTPLPCGALRDLPLSPGSSGAPILGLPRWHPHAPPPSCAAVWPVTTPSAELLLDDRRCLVAVHTSRTLESLGRASTPTRGSHCPCEGPLLVLPGSHAGTRHYMSTRGTTLEGQKTMMMVAVYAATARHQGTNGVSLGQPTIPWSRRCPRLLFEEVRLRGTGVRHVAFQLFPPLWVHCNVLLELFPRLLGTLDVGPLHLRYGTYCPSLRVGEVPCRERYPHDYILHEERRWNFDC